MMRISFIENHGWKPMTGSGNLDKWIDDKKEKQTFSKSLFTQEQITAYTLKEKIAELEKMRDHILYELDKLSSLAEEIK
jgi:hypothetical protein